MCVCVDYSGSVSTLSVFLLVTVSPLLHISNIFIVLLFASLALSLNSLVDCL